MTNNNRTQVLIVDDEPLVRTTLARALAQDGFECTEAASAAEALIKADAINPAVVVTDIHMPHGDGISLLRQLRIDYPDTQVLMITGQCNVDTAIKSVTLGASSYLTKPVEPAELFIHVAHAAETNRRLVAERAYVRILEERLQTFGLTVI